MEKGVQLDHARVALRWFASSGDDALELCLPRSSTLSGHLPGRRMILGSYCETLHASWTSKWRQHVAGHAGRLLQAVGPACVRRYCIRASPLAIRTRQSPWQTAARQSPSRHCAPSCERCVLQVVARYDAEPPSRCCPKQRAVRQHCPQPVRTTHRNCTLTGAIFGKKHRRYSRVPSRLSPRACRA